MKRPRKVIKLSAQPICETETKTNFITPYKILLHNDDHNTFDHVIATLIELFGYTTEDSEKMAIEVHTKGLCNVKGGLSQEHAEFYCDKLVAKSLTASIEPE